MKIITITYIFFLFFYLCTFSLAQENITDYDPNFVQFQKGVEAVKNKEYALAADIFEELAVSGDMDAQFNYAILVRNGLGRAQNYSEALYWTWLSYASGLEKADKVLEKILELVGVGYRAALKGNKLNLQLGYSHEIDFDIPEGIKIMVEKQTTLKITGSNKQQVGSIASKLKTLRKIEPYKGKGI